MPDLSANRFSRMNMASGYSGGYLSVNNFPVVIAAWLNACQREVKAVFN